ncbi:MAG TPA: response regulator [Firmicutes bacterium]|nr:response regulator [Bacillota bacterium]
MLLRERTAGRSAHPDAGAGAEGIALAPYTLLILDLMLPGLNGFEVMGQARAYTDVPILFLSARDAKSALLGPDSSR